MSSTSTGTLKKNAVGLDYGNDNHNEDYNIFKSNQLWLQILIDDALRK